MTIRFNDEIEFPINTINEMHSAMSAVSDILICNLPYSEELYNEVYNFLTTTEVFKIEVLNNIRYSMYTTSSLVKYKTISKSISNDSMFIQINFGI